jgi:hypothetical protein
MQIAFTAFADDSIFTGNLALEADRLSDVVAADDGFRIQDVEITALDTGRTLTAASAEITRGDFAAMTANGPRGNPARRFPTRQHPIRTEIGPYQVVGYLHAPRSAHVLAGAVRRRVVPITSATIRYRLGASEIRRSFDVLLLNGDRLVWAEPASRAEMTAGAALEARATLGRPGDMRGNVSH